MSQELKETMLPKLQTRYERRNREGKSLMFERGQGVTKDAAAAADWLRRAAEGGDAGGQHNLGVRCHRASLDPLRLSAKESRIEAYKWFRLAAA